MLAKVSLVKIIYDSLPEPKPNIYMANGSVNKAAGVCHLLVTLKFSTIIKSLCLPVFICDFLSLTVNCIFGIDAGRDFKYVLYYDTGTLWCLDDPNQTPLYCIPKVITQEDNFYARVLKLVVIKAQSFSPVEVGTHNSMPRQEWRSQVLCTCIDNIWTEYGATVLQGGVDFTNYSATLCIINTTFQI